MKSKEVGKRESKFRHFVVDQSGSYALESGIVFPVVFILSIVLFLMPFAIYAQVETQYRTQYAVNEAATQWVHRADDILQNETGWQREDGLYWRLTTFSGGSWLQKFEPQDSFEGDLLYDKGLFISSIEGQFHAPLHLPSYYDVIPTYQVGASKAWITDPVEWIRTIDMIRVYGAELINRQKTKADSDQALQKFLGWQGDNEFSSHDPAAKYLRQLVNGIETQKSTPYGTRKMDALTSSGTLHQAYLTFRINGKSGLRAQMEKDAYLLKEGEVEAVVWHFFKRKGDSGTVGPSESFIQELKQNGITVVIHDSR